MVPAECGGLLHQCDSREPQAQIDRESLGAVWAADCARQAFSSSTASGCGRTAYCHPRCSSAGIQHTCAATCFCVGPVLSTDVLLYGNTTDTTAVLMPAWRRRGMAARTGRASHIPAMTTKVQTVAWTTTSTERYGLVSVSVGHGFAAAWTDPINPVFDAFSPQPSILSAGHTHVLLADLVNYFNPAFSWYESLFGPSNCSGHFRVSDCVTGTGTRSARASALSPSTIQVITTYLLCDLSPAAQAPGGSSLAVFLSQGFPNGARDL